MPNLKQNDTGSMDIEGKDNGSYGFIPVTLSWVAASTDAPAFVATRAYRVHSIIARPLVAGTDGGAVTAVVKKAPSGTAIASGTAVNSGTINLKGTADTNQTITVATNGTANLDAGDALGLDFTGTLTSAIGFVTVMLAPR